MTRRACPWCGGTDTHQIGDAGSLLMTTQWFCDGCSSAFEVIRKRGDEGDHADGGDIRASADPGRDGERPPRPRGPVVSTGSDPGLEGQVRPRGPVATTGSDRAAGGGRRRRRAEAAERDDRA